MGYGPTIVFFTGSLESFKGDAYNHVLDIGVFALTFSHNSADWGLSFLSVAEVLDSACMVIIQTLLLPREIEWSQMETMLLHHNIPIIVLLGLFLLEQICCFFPGAFPYRLGIAIKSLTMSPVDSAMWLNLKGQAMQLSIYIQEDRIYLKRRYPALSWGPSLFIGTIEKKISFDKISIKICPLSAFVIAILLIEPIVSGGLVLNTWHHVLWTLFGYFIAIFTLLYFYFDFKDRVHALLRLTNISSDV